MSSTPENVNVKTVKTTTVTDVRIGVMNVQSLGNKLDCVIDHITDNRIDIVGITETWLSNDDKNNMSMVTPYSTAPETLVEGVEVSGTHQQPEQRQIADDRC